MRVPDHRDELGPPNIKLGGLELWVHGRECLGDALPWDADWLNVTAYCVAPGARVWVSGPVLSSTSFARWSAECEVLCTKLSGRAELHSYEPNLRVLLECSGSTNGIVLAVFLTPDHLRQEHRFEWELDESYLPQLLDDVRAIVHSYPVPAGLTAL